MMNHAEVEQCIAEGRETLVHLAELVVNGKQTRGDAYSRAQVEHDALVSLLDQAPPSEHARIHDLLLRYDMMMASLVH